MVSAAVVSNTSSSNSRQCVVTAAARLSRWQQQQRWHIVCTENCLCQHHQRCPREDDGMILNDDLQVWNSL